jgi:putative transcriptional regulator
MSTTASLAGSFLVARHGLADPQFRRAVILMIDHDSEGAFGVVVNRSARNIRSRSLLAAPARSTG